MTIEFSYDGYRSLLDAIARPRKCVTFGELRGELPDGPTLILRHDIDMSLEAALRMAEIEAAIGVRATYFLLFSGAWYNLMGNPGATVPRMLRELGHEVGLHYDVQVLQAGRADPMERLEDHARMLSQLSGEPVRSIAMHNPSIDGDDPVRESRFVNAYDPRFTQDIPYYSDSCGAWRNEFIERLRKDDFPPALQLLTHPVLWGAAHRDRWTKLNEFLSEDIRHRQALAEDIRNLWRGHSGVREHDEREGLPPG